MTVAVVLLGVVVALLAVLVVSLLRSHAEILRALHDLGVDLDPANPADAARATRAARAAAPASTASAAAAAAPIEVPPGELVTQEGVPAPGELLGMGAFDLVGTDPSGDAVAIGVLGGTHRTLLAFLTTGCTTCHQFWSAFAEGVELPAPDIRLVVVTQGHESESPARVAELAPPGVDVVLSSDAWEDYGVPVAPYFALVDGDEVVGEGAAASWPQVVDLLGRSLADTGRALGAPGGSPSRRAFLTGRDRAERVDAELAAAGIRPGDPRLYEPVVDVDAEEGR
ncbi:hypothetical protein [Dermatobacter hominis]|uniref:hypothetical protein n=1 Tax=Dermatobacter hominis TaxID=2884263 RepID=UPI001D117266|nr:hypothetical protein [Dermatobacter hominis]UDY34042.1 hypothetical protein LH044_11870 [Dermatobacter hominis]